MILSLPLLVVTYLLVNRYRGIETKSLQGLGPWLLGAIAFLGFQLLLTASLFELVFKGPQVNWQQIAGTRVPVTVEATA
jgi:hypothetical protein